VSYAAQPKDWKLILRSAAAVPAALVGDGATPAIIVNWGAKPPSPFTERREMYLW